MVCRIVDVLTSTPQYSGTIWSTAPPLSTHCCSCSAPTDHLNLWNYLVTEEFLAWSVQKQRGFRTRPEQIWDLSVACSASPITHNLGVKMNLMDYILEGKFWANYKTDMKFKVDSRKQRALINCCSSTFNAMRGQVKVICR